MASDKEDEALHAESWKDMNFWSRALGQLLSSPETILKLGGMHECKNAVRFPESFSQMPSASKMCFDLSLIPDA